MGLIAKVEKKKKELKKGFISDLKKEPKKEKPKEERVEVEPKEERVEVEEDPALKILEKLKKVEKPKEEVKEEKEDPAQKVLDNLDKVEKPKEEPEEKKSDIEKEIVEKLEEIDKPKKKKSKISSKKKKPESSSKEKKKTEEVEKKEEPKEKTESPFASIKRRIEGKLRRTKPEFDPKEDMEDIKEEIEEELGTDKKFIKIKGRIATGLPGLDQLMEGGFIKKSMVLVVGGAGSGKSIFSMQFLINGVHNYNESGIYITFEQNQEKVLRDYERFDWNMEDKVKNGKLVILPYTPEQVDRFLDSGGGIVRDIIDKIGAKRVVVDSISAFLLLYPSELEKRRAVYKLYETMSKWNCTTLLIDEHEPHPEIHESTVVEFQADTVLLLYNQRKGDIRERSMEIFKMRATQHTQKIFPMKIDDSGITIYPDASVF